MSARQKPCPDCRDLIVTAAAPNGGRLRLEPYPAPRGKYRVDVLAHGLVVLTNRQNDSARTKRYDPHKCTPAGKAVRRPEVRPQQLELGL